MIVLQGGGTAEKNVTRHSNVGLKMLLNCMICPHNFYNRSLIEFKICFLNLFQYKQIFFHQSRELEHALVERTRQICRLRWELLNRDVSTMRLQTEMQHAKWQQTPTKPTTASQKRKWYGQKRSWSSSEALSLKLSEVKLTHFLFCSKVYYETQLITFRSPASKINVFTTN